VVAEFADAPDPHGPASDKGSVSVGLRHIGPDGLGSLAWSANWPSEQLGEGGQFTATATDGQATPVIYAPNTGALEADEDCHSWYSPYVSVEGLSVSSHQLVGTRTMELYVDHTNILTDGSPPSALNAIVVSMAPIQMLMQIHELSCGGGPREDVCQVGPCEAAGAYRFFVTGMDGHGPKSKYAGNVEHPVAPAAADFTIPSASCIAGSATTGGGNDEYPPAQGDAQLAWEELGSVRADSADATQDCFYSARYAYGLGWRGGYLDRPGKEQTLDALFADRVVVFRGHGSEVTIRNREYPDKVDADSIRERRDQPGGHPSQAKLVVLQCCLAGMDTPASVASALVYAGVGCVIGWTGPAYPDDPGFAELLDLMCDQGLDAADAHDLVCRHYPTTWRTGTRCIGNAELWGEPI